MLYLHFNDNGKAGDGMNGKGSELKKGIIWLLVFSSACAIADTSAETDAEKALSLESLYDLTLEELREVSVITAASGYEQNLQRASSNATVIAREEWQAMGAYTLADVLRAVPGVHVGKPKINFSHHQVSIRGLSGAYGEQIKLLIDGQPFEYMQDGGNHLGFNMPIGMFKRIEVIKGPGSAIYGADAFGGIINLVSDKAGQAPSKWVARTGSFGTRSLSAQQAFNPGEHHFSVALDYIKSDDDPDRVVSSDLQSTFDQVFATNASTAPGVIDEHYEVLSLATQWQWQQWSFGYRTWRNFDAGTGAGIAQTLDSRGHANVKTDFAELNRDLSSLLSVGSLNLTLNYQHQDSNSFLYVFPAGSTLPIGADGNADFVNPVGVTLFSDGYIGTPSSTGNTRSVKLTHLFDLKDQHIRWQIGYETQQFRAFERKNFGPSVLDGSQAVVDGTLTDVSKTDFVYLPAKQRNFYYASLQDEWQFTDDILLTLGLRYDHYSDFGSTTNPRVGLLWNIQPQFTFKLFAGSAFRAPSFTDQYSQNNPVGLGNTALKPEGVNTYETGGGFDYLINQDLSLALNIFSYQADDLIRHVLDPVQNVNRAQNVGQQKGRGGELSLRWKPRANITINANYSRLHATDDVGVDVADVPKQMGYLSINWGINQHWNGFIDSKWVAERMRASSDLRPKIDNYLHCSARLAHKNLFPGLTLALIAKNLFNEDARAPSDGRIADDYPLAGRQWLFELNYVF
ncbi:MAG: outer membrane receptor for ferrienterochelin and colicins [Phenylobacterium sp.]